MRWLKPRVGDTRKVTKFAWLPVGDSTQTIWLERVTVTYRYHSPWAGWTVVLVI
jgi:hypothetical protein